MGGSFSKQNAVFIQTDKPVYTDGEVVQGLVCLNIKDAVDIAGIECQLLGKESTYWTESHDHGTGSHHYTTTETHGGTLEMLSVTAPLPGGGRRMEPGQYQWPVVFALPPGVPSTFDVKRGAEGAEVTYQISAIFHTPGFLTKALRATQVLTVRQRMPALAVSVDQSADLQLVSCCCINRGSVSAHVRMDRDRCQPGEEVTVILELDNGRSKLAIDSIDLCLKRELYAYERPGCTGNSRKFNTELCKSRHEGVQPFTTLQGGMARRMQLRLPADLPPSMRGALIVCTYYVRVELNIGSFVKDVRLKVPLIVMAPQPVPTAEAPFFTEPPPFWSPTETLAPQGINVPSAPPLPAELLQPDAPFWARSQSHGHGTAGMPAPAAAAAATPPPVPPSFDASSKYQVV